jgi:4-hydroxybenzoate polyprenyltransferase
MERFAWMLVFALGALIVLGVLIGSPTAWVLLSVGVIGVLGYGEFLIRRKRRLTH